MARSGASPKADRDPHLFDRAAVAARESVGASLPAPCCALAAFGGCSCGGKTHSYFALPDNATRRVSLAALAAAVRALSDDREQMEGTPADLPGALGALLNRRAAIGREVWAEAVSVLVDAFGGTVAELPESLVADAAANGVDL